MTAIFSILGPVVLWGLKQWIKSQALSEEQKKNYYAFLEDVDKHTKIDVTNYIAAGNAREETIRRINDRRKQLGLNSEGKLVEDSDPALTARARQNPGTRFERAKDGTIIPAKKGAKIPKEYR